MLPLSKRRHGQRRPTCVEDAIIRYACLPARDGYVYNQPNQVRSHGVRVLAGKLAWSNWLPVSASAPGRALVKIMTPH